MIKLLLTIAILFLCQNAFADFNSGDVFGKGIIVQANGTTQTGGGRVLNFASGTTVSVVNNGYQITASGGGGTPGGANTQIQYNSSGSFAGNSGFIYNGTNVGIGSSNPGQRLDVNGSVNIGGSGNIYFANGSNLQYFVGQGLANPGASLAAYSATLGNSTSVQVTPTNATMVSRPGLNGNPAYSSVYIDNTGSAQLNGGVTGNQSTVQVENNGQIDVLGSGAGLHVEGPSSNVGYVYTDTLLGIAQTNPQYGIDINGNNMSINISGCDIGDSAVSGCYIDNTGDATFPIIEQDGNTVCDAGGNCYGIYGTATSGTNLLFGNGGDGFTNVPNTATSAGNVSIGTTNATGGRLIVMGGNVGIGTTIANNGILQFASATSSTSGIAFGSDATIYRSGAGSLFFGANINTNGNVSAGHITVSSSTTSGNNIQWGSDSPISGIYRSNVSTLTSPSAWNFTGNVGIGIGTNSAVGNSLIIATGNVGIGSLSPGQALDVQGTVRSSLGFVSGSNCFYYCNGGVDLGVLSRGSSCLCPSGTCVATNICSN